MSDQSNEGLFSPLLQKVRVKKVIKYLKGNVLDFGCGNGFLANYVSINNYYGYDSDINSIYIAQTLHSNYKFTSTFDNDFLNINFDTFILIALIEHLKDPKDILISLSKKMNINSTMIITTPHPFFKSFYEFGSKFGLFSKSACNEHEKYYNYNDLNIILNKINMEIIYYERFLFYANQLFIINLKKI